MKIEKNQYKKREMIANFFIVKRYKMCSLIDNSRSINRTIYVRLLWFFFNYISSIFMKNNEN